MVFTVLIGFVNEMVSSTIDGINQGSSRICLTGHTLILGWNQATVRCVVQIAHLRAGFKAQNKSFTPRWLWWTRVKPSTTVAVAPIVVLCDSMSKAEMDAALSNALVER